MRRIPGLTYDDVVLRWSPDGTALWVSSADDPQRIERLDVITGRRTPLVTVDLPGEPGIQLRNVSLADDPQVYAIATNSVTSLIFSIRGIR